jgi:hypothetical protein
VAKPKRICSVEGCGKYCKSDGFCCLHYSRWKRRGDPLALPKIVHGSAQKFFFEVVVPYDADECLFWPFSRGAQGYGEMRYQGKLRIIPRFLCEIVHGKPPTPKHQAAHRCGKGAQGCCNSRHLYWATRSENEQDKLAHGTSNRGSRNGKARLTEDDVREIRRLVPHANLKVIAEMFGVSRLTISAIANGQNWTWLA